MAINWQGRMLGRYQLLRLLGRGGMGEVWLADDTQLRRQVAVKLLPTVMASDKNHLQDFKYEARAIAGLEHPHILPVHDFGEQVTSDEVTTYLVMPYIMGGSLRDRMHTITAPLPVDEVISDLKQAAEAIDYAHAQQVLHRDIKPGNMLLQDEWLLLADFGLAKLLTSSTYRSRTHAGAGTPEYMAPEQIMGKAEAASDRYSLAVIAYQALTGHLPFRGETPYSTLIKQMRDTPPSPRQFNPNMPQMVEDTLLQGLAKRPEERLSSCLAFVNALAQGWKLSQIPQTDPEATVLAPWSKRQQEEGHARQKRAIPSAPVLLPLSVEQATIVETVPKAPLESAPYMPTVVPPLSLPNTVPGEKLDVPVTPAPERQKGHVSRRAVVIGGATAIVATAVASKFALPALLHDSSPIAKKAPPGPKHLIPGVPVLSLTGHTNNVWDAAWDPTGRYLVTAGTDTHVLLWDIGSALQKNANSFQTISTPTKSWKFQGEIDNSMVSWSADGRSIIATYIGTDDANKVSLLDPFGNSTTPVIYKDTHADPINLPTYLQLAWQPNTEVFAAAQSSLPATVKVNLWKRGQTDTPFKSFAYNAGNFITSNEVVWSLDGKMLAASTDNYKVVVWEAITGKVKQVIKLPDRTQGRTFVQLFRNALTWSPTDPNVLLVSNIDVVEVWNVQQNKLLYTFGTDAPDALTPPKNHADTWLPNTLGVTWSPNGRYIIGGYGRSSKMYLWDLQNQHPTIKNGKHIQDAFLPASGRSGGHNGIIIDVAWSPNGRYIASASSDTTVIIWKVDQ